MAQRSITLKKQINDIKDIRVTVKALEKIAAANVHNLETTSQQMLDYETELINIWSSVDEAELKGPLFRKSVSSRRLKVVLTTQKGLCGGMLNRLLDFVELNLSPKDEIILIGEEGKRLFQERGIKIDYFFDGTNDIPQEKDIEDIKNTIISKFVQHYYKEVSVIYPRFISLPVQSPEDFHFLPLRGESWIKEGVINQNANQNNDFPIYEPNLDAIIGYLVKDYLGLVFYQKILEAKLSELAARTVAMENAADKAKKLIHKLSIRYFRMKRWVETKNMNDLYSHEILK